MGSHPKKSHGAKTTDHPSIPTSIARSDRRAELSDEREREGKAAPFDPLDPAARQVAQLAPPPTTTSPPLEIAGAEVAPRARVSMEELLPQLVRRIAWAGDRRRGTVQLELGAGRHEGTVVTVHADGGRVRVELQGANVDELRARIGARLAHRGIEVDSLT